MISSYYLLFSVNYFNVSSSSANGSIVWSWETESNPSNKMAKNRLNSILLPINIQMIKNIGVTIGLAEEVWGVRNTVNISFQFSIVIS